MIGAAGSNKSNSTASGTRRAVRPTKALMIISNPTTANPVPITATAPTELPATVVITSANPRIAARAAMAIEASGGPGGRRGARPGGGSRMVSSAVLVIAQWARCPPSTGVTHPVALARNASVGTAVPDFVTGGGVGRRRRIGAEIDFGGGIGVEIDFGCPVWLGGGDFGGGIGFGAEIDLGCLVGPDDGRRSWPFDLGRWRWRWW